MARLQGRPSGIDATTARRTRTPSERVCRSQTLVDLVVRPLDGVTATLTVRAAVAPVTVLVATLLSTDSTPAALTTRTLKYQVAGDSEPMVAVRAVGSEMFATRVMAPVLVPYITLKLVRSVSVEPSVLRVGAFQLTLAVPVL